MARVVEFIWLVAGYALDVDDMEAIPATATSTAMHRWQERPGRLP
jgi:hypothetical protein